MLFIMVLVIRQTLTPFILWNVERQILPPHEPRYGQATHPAHTNSESQVSVELFLIHVVLASSSNTR